MNRRAFFPGGEAEIQRSNRDVQWRLSLIAESKFEGRYLSLLKLVLDWVAGRLANDAEAMSKDEGGVANWRYRWIGTDPFTSGSYQFTLKLAVLYPIFIYFSIWLFTNSGNLGGIILLPDMPGWQRALLFVAVACEFFLFFKAFTKDGIESVLFMLGAVAVAGAVAFAFAGAVAGAGAGAGAGAVAVAFAGAVAVAFAFLWEWLDDQVNSPKGRFYYWVSFNLFYLIIPIVLLWLFAAEIKKPELLVITVFLVILPLANALLDWVSLGITRGLLHAISDGHHAGGMAIFWALADLLFAILFLFGISILITALIALMNWAMIAGGAQHHLFDLKSLFDGLALAPMAPSFGWIHFMVLSTLIPTLIHFFIASAALMLLLPSTWRKKMVESIDTSNDARSMAVWYLSLVPFLAIAGPAVFLILGYQLISANGAQIGLALLNTARSVAAFIDPSF